MVKRRVGSKGQITLPKQIRELLGLEPGGEVLLELRGGEVVLRARRGIPLEALRGRLKSPVPFPGKDKERQAREQVWAQDA
ncbi:AbrB/MazE/SpoVT family DNA-binding domain-containing protein [Meiothermus taiwanensis]|jgi:antitoxin PrlF|uniref:AbrB/MazE/SpoVT family DNA-binding domain-containing protein n=1 Tax=Meiothermus taiwanensis TaxID=172827 RepID=UPI0005B6DFBD|nr:AbrB/MazE/SpoVT family DNA-binding domain-containing protein [Meiothermus taiwanensis]KIQ54874.1 AbrB family transcriptional regulator [Meiothermus taiwanensis]KZK16950.1 AbrB family transcriptional regulator [Meiothermus taiwanensis]